ncbi:DUF5709 domain-containing protein [Streptomyces sp. RFCAC02]|uniref:DUF5709 domain-containing protein n=1 Tax=Streptomyces sp. RFCAC02 TaxID=2499143 RepID=UPI00101FEF2D|nr:DUF5709 domain-containing protein [Streptomyces sp. RFCAC02]
MGDEVYQPTESVDREDVTYTGDLENALGEPDLDETLDEGYSPPEKPLAVTGHGLTAREQEEGETLDQRLSEEVPDVRPPDGDGIGDQQDAWGEPVADGEAGGDRAGRLVSADDDLTPRRPDSDVTAYEVGVDGGAAGAEEAAMHIADLDEAAGTDDGTV